MFSQIPIIKPENGNPFIVFRNRGWPQRSILITAKFSIEQIICFA